MHFEFAFGDFAGFCVSQPLCSSLMTSYVLNAEDLQCFQPSKMKECEVDFEGRRMQWGCGSKGGCSRQIRNFRYDCENFARIAKISLGLRKFRNHSENFAIIAKISQS